MTAPRSADARAVDLTVAHVDVVATADDVAAAAAARVVAAAEHAIATTGRFTIALSGGSTPKRLYALLATVEWRSRIPWSHVDVWWGDERCVPPEHPASNYRLAREALLDRVPVSPSHVHRIRGELAPRAAADAYEIELRRALATPQGPPRPAPGARLDLVLLGMGDNGHTLSLFPRSPLLAERRRWVAPDRVDAEPPWRVTVTAPVANAAAAALFLVAGRDKAPMLRRVLRGPYDPWELPAQLVAPTAGTVRWIVDAAAAAELER